MQQQFLAPQQKRKLNAFFVMLAVISAVPTAFFLLVWAQNMSGLSAFLVLWSGAWTYVWWSLRYR